MPSTPVATISEAPCSAPFVAGSYANLPPLEKREFKKRILGNPYALSIFEIRGFMEQSFPFTPFDHQWLASYLQLVDFYRIHQHCNVRTPPLSPWTNRQRYKRLHGKQELGREQALNQIGYVWNVEAARWN